MKKIIFTLLIFHCSIIITNNLFSQLTFKWYEIPTGVTSNLNSIYERYIVGDNGLILFRNYNGSFIQRQSGTSANLYLLFPPPPLPSNLLTICGANGVILSSTNYGVNWNQQISGVSNTLYSKNRIMYITTPPITTTTRHICVGESGTIISSTNNGINWYSLSSPVSVDLKSVNFIQGVTLYYQGGTIVGNNGTILKSSNGGLNWFIVPSGVTENLNYVHFFGDTLSGWIVGNNGKILKTTNGGYNWTTMSSQTTNNLNYIGVFYNAGYLIAGNNGTVLNSTDGGNSWINLNTNIFNDLTSAFYDDTTETIFAVGKNGKLYARRLDSSYQCNLKGNNISSHFQIPGVFNNFIDFEYESVPGFEWPKDSMKSAVFSSGLNISAKINGQLRRAAASYLGEYKPGYCINGNFQTDNRFKFYKVKRSDNASNNPDWANWGQMVQFGAPFIDVNNNGTYEPQIDTPGVRNASETIFLCSSDADPSSHKPGEGFGGGTAPLGAEIHMTAWCYNNATLKDIQYIKWIIINKNTMPWNNTYISIFTDPDIGNLKDDFIGCDTTRKLGFAYNAKSSDTIYGNNPPAFGIDLLKGSFNRSVVPSVNLGFTSFTFTISNSYIPQPPPCETDPDSPFGAYQIFRGFKRDTSYILDPTFYPPKKTKFAFSGDPETNTGWSAAKGKINNCGGDTTGPVYINPDGFEIRFMMNSGADNFTMVPNDTQIIIIAQMIARQTNNKSNFSSVTKLKYLDDVAQEVYNSGFNVDIQKNTISIPERFFLSQNYPNPFNPLTKIKFQIKKEFRSQESEVKLIIYDILGREIQTLVNEKLNPGNYEITFDGSNLPSGIYFYQLRVGDFLDTKKMLLIK